MSWQIIPIIFLSVFIFSCKEKEFDELINTPANEKSTSADTNSNAKLDAKKILIENGKINSGEKIAKKINDVLLPPGKRQEDQSNECKNGCDNNLRPNKNLGSVKPRDLHPLVGGAYKVSATRYGCCNILKTARSDFTQKLESPVTCQRPKKCVEAIPSEYKYLLGGKPYFKHNRGIKDLHVKKELDCSGFISTALLASGARLYPSDHSNATMPNAATSNFETIQKDSKSCIEKVSIDKNSSIKPGDMLNLALINRPKGNKHKSRAHIVMIDTVGSDPLGINNAAKNGAAGCNQITADDFDFTFIHSTSGLFNLSSPVKYKKKNISQMTGVRRDQAKLLPSIMRTNLTKIAKTHCLGIVKYKNGNQSQSIGLDSGLKYNLSLLRHKGDKNPKCMFTPVPNLLEERCVNDCLKDFRVGENS